MAPDLLPMCGAIAAEPTCAKVTAGQAHHLAADARFHGTQAFTTLAAWAARTLIEAGVPRGPARGAAHVAIELFLDGVLAEDAAACAAYRRSLAEADTAQSPFLWADEPSRGRWRDAGGAIAGRNGPQRLPRGRIRGRPRDRGSEATASAGPRRSRGDEAAGVSPRAQTTRQRGSGRAWRWTGDGAAAFARGCFRQRRLSGSCERAPAGMPPVTSAAVRRPFVHNVRSVMMR